MRRLNVEEWFWRGVDKAGDCWIWTRCRDRRGYGRFSAKGHRRAHRFSWALTNGPIPPGMCVLHRCDNPPCVNPAHLFVGTSNDNVADMMAKGRFRNLAMKDPSAHAAHLKARVATRTHCKNGHEFSPSNTRLRGATRICRACHNITERARRAAGLIPKRVRAS